MWVQSACVCLGLLLLPVQSWEAPWKRAHVVCYQCPQIKDPAECRLVTSKCHTCQIVKNGGLWDLGCGDHGCQSPQCCTENLCNGKIVCPSGQYPNGGECTACGHCLGGPAECSTDDGSCPNGCEEGWHGDMCDQSSPTSSPGVTSTPPTDCPPGRYGPGCASFCSGRCHLGSVCDSVTGDCPELNGLRCEPGYKGTRCDQACEGGQYGSQCLNACSAHCYNNTDCYPDSGFCPILASGTARCSAGWEGAYCNLDCARMQWGEDCTNVCSPHCWDSSPCDAVTGVCELLEDNPRCGSGWFGEKCDQACPRGLTGEDCLQNCTGHCYKDAACDPVTGYCPASEDHPRCAAGWSGTTCMSSCPHDRYGEDCVDVCSSSCYNGGLCDGITGFCPLVEGQPRCEDGWTGARCDKVCAIGSEACVQTCTDHCFSPNACDPSNGVCNVIGPNPRCTSGWFGNRCDIPCPPGTHGVDCGALCDGFCYHGAACDRVNGTCPQLLDRPRCEAGWEGEKCDISCRPHTWDTDCKKLCSDECYNNSACDVVSGACKKEPGKPRCSAGWQNPFCDQRCIDGRFGEDCLKVCSGNCYEGAACDKRTGECPISHNGSRCEAGFFGASCEWSCNPGTYGEDCQQLCSGHCYDLVSCEPITGKCPLNQGIRKCMAGYNGDKCEHICSPGTYGENCRERCGSCLDDHVCNPVSGICPSGCQPGHMPPLCK